MSQILARIIRGVAEGKYGAAAKKVYWFLAGKKTITGIVCAAAYAGLLAAQATGTCAECGKYAETLAYVAGFLVTVGLFDAAVRLDPPKISD